MEKDFDYYEDLIKKNKLPDGFDEWLMKGKFSYTLAHFAAYKGILPPDWTDKKKDWLIENNYGDTVAHYASCNGILPPDWTNKPEDWLIEDGCWRTIGFCYSENSKHHYNDPKTLEDYCQNMNDHLFPIFRDNSEIFIFHLKSFNNFLNPFLKSIQEQKQDEWMKTSESYSGFLIDYTESIVSYIQDNLRFVDNIQGDDLILANQIKENLEQTSQHLQNEKIKIKEHLFAHHESKNQSIINEKEPSFSETL